MLPHCTCWERLGLRAYRLYIFDEHGITGDPMRIQAQNDDLAAELVLNIMPLRRRALYSELGLVAVFRKTISGRGSREA